LFTGFYIFPDWFAVIILHSLCDGIIYVVPFFFPYLSSAFFLGLDNMPETHINLKSTIPSIKIKTEGVEKLLRNINPYKASGPGLLVSLFPLEVPLRYYLVYWILHISKMSCCYYSSFPL
jgi:hypothetical protein